MFKSSSTQANFMTFFNTYETKNFKSVASIRLFDSINQ